MADHCGSWSVLAALLLAGAAHGQTFTWAAGVDGEWDTPTDWTPNGVPMGSEDIAIIDVDGAPDPYTVSLNGFDVNIAELSVINDDATLSGAGAGGSVMIRDAVMLANSTLIEFTFDSMGMLDIDGTLCDDLCDVVLNHTGPTITWQNTGDIALQGTSTFSIGALSEFTILNAQTIMIDDGATLINAGTIRKTGSGPTAFMRTGGAGTFENPGIVEVTDGMLDTDALDLVGDTLEEGTWTVRNGSTLNLLGQSVVTNRASITLDGLGSTFPQFESSISVNDTSGVIAIAGATNTFTTPGDFTNDGLVDVGAGSRFTVELGSDFTNFAGGTITGGQLDLEGVFQFSGAAIDAVDASVTLDGVGSGIFDELDNDALSVLDMIMAGGTLAITNGRDLSVAAPLLTVEGNLMVGPEFGGDPSTLMVAGSIDQPSGVTLLDGGSIMHGGSYSLGIAGELRGNGTVTGPIISSGRWGPGFSPGELILQPQASILPEAVVEIELGGVNPVLEHDRIQVFGLLQFEGPGAGTLEVSLIDGFLPMPGEVFDVIIANAIEGEFANVVTTNFPCELGAQVNYINLKEFFIVQVEVVERCLADCNNDGNVDILDFMCFQMEWQGQTPCGDCNGDGLYNVLDFVCFQNVWQNGC